MSSKSTSEMILITYVNLILSTVTLWAVSFSYLAYLLNKINKPSLFSLRRDYNSAHNSYAAIQMKNVSPVLLFSFTPCEVMDSFSVFQVPSVCCRKKTLLIEGLVSYYLIIYEITICLPLCPSCSIIKYL